MMIKSWFTLARPFAMRRAIYRKKFEQRLQRAIDYGLGPDSELLNGRAEASKAAMEAVEMLWSEVVAHLNREASAAPCVRASDGRPDDPYNGQAAIDDVSEKYKSAPAEPGNV